MPAEKSMTRVEVYTVAIRALNRQMGATKHKPTRRKLERTRWALSHDRAFLIDELKEMPDGDVL